MNEIALLLSGARRTGRALLCVAALGATACGFGTYDDGASPANTSSNSGVADAGPWWPWVCPDGSNPSPASASFNFTASGSCGAGGPFSISVDGCLLSANFEVLGLSQAQTVTHSSTPQLGGWVVSGVSSADQTTALTCSSSVPDAAGSITFTCSAGEPPETSCQSTLAPAVSP